MSQPSPAFARATMFATGLLMTGPKAQRPRYRAVRKAALRIMRGAKITPGGWRSWPKEKSRDA